MQINFNAIPLFASLNRLERARLIPHFSLLDFSSGEVIVHQGDQGDCLYLIASGSVRVARHTTDGTAVDVAVLKQGECFGELALLTGETRTADVVAIDDQTTVFRLSRERFNGLLKQHNALALKIASILAKRISRTNGHVGNGDQADVLNVPEPIEEDETRELPSSAGLKAGWSLGVKLRSRRFISSALSVVLCSIVALLLSRTSVRVARHTADGTAVDVAVLKQGECFGELALLTGETRTADVVAVDDQTTVFRLSRERFNGLLKQHNALALKIASILAKRISRTNGHVGNGDQADVLNVPEPIEEDETRELPSSAGLKAGWSLGVKLRSRRFISSALSVALCSIVALLLSRTDMTYQQITLLVLLLGATVTWSFDAFSYHAVALALPLAAVVLNAATPTQAFSGFSHPSWFLVLGVFAISAAISKTGLMYRLVLQVISRFPASYRWQSFALAFSGMFLTPIIPSSNGRAVLAGPLVANLSEILRFRRGSAGSIGMSMAALLGFGHMSFLFMNGTATCLLAFGLLPQQVITRVTWSSWFLAALPLGLIFFCISYLAILIQYQPKVQRASGSSVITKQLTALGPYSEHEQITILLVIASLLGFITQSWHHVNGAWIALTSFFLLFAFGVLPEKSVRSDIDWNFLLSFGALVGFGGLISSSGLSGVMAVHVAPLLQYVKSCPYAFLVRRGSTLL